MSSSYQRASGKFTYSQLVALCDGFGTFDVPCPSCGPERRTETNRKREVLRIFHEKAGLCDVQLRQMQRKGSRAR